MPTVTQAPVKAFAHCTNPRCPGAYQVEVDALRVETSFLFSDNGGDIPGVERSVVRAVFVEDDDAECPHCLGARDLSLTPRPSYQPLSGHDPMGLLGMPAFDPGKVNTPNDQHTAEIEALQSKLAEQGEMLAKLLEQATSEDAA